MLQQQLVDGSIFHPGSRVTLLDDTFRYNNKATDLYVIHLFGPGE